MPRLCSRAFWVTSGAKSTAVSELPYGAVNAQEAANIDTSSIVEMTMGPQNTPVEMDFTNFRWNASFPPGHFEMTVPEGYQLRSAPAAN